MTLLENSALRYADDRSRLLKIRVNDPLARI